MKVLAIANNKGGVGKTKTSTLVDEYIARELREYFENLKKRVLLIDLDPQCNYSNLKIQMEFDTLTEEGKRPPIHPDYDQKNPEDAHWDGRSSIANLFFGDAIVPYPTECDFIDILPGHAHKLLEAEKLRKDELVTKLVNVFCDFIWGKDVQETYELIIIDTGPSKGSLTRAAMRAATHLLIPSVMEILSIEGVYGMMHLWQTEQYNREGQDPPELVGILPNMYTGTNLHKDLLSALKKNPKVSEYVLDVELPRQVVYAEIDVKSSSPRSIFDLPEKNKARIAATKACELIMGKILK